MGLDVMTFLFGECVKSRLGMQQLRFVIVWEVDGFAIATSQRLFVQLVPFLVVQSLRLTAACSLLLSNLTTQELQLAKLIIAMDEAGLTKNCPIIPDRYQELYLAKNRNWRIQIA